MMKNRASCGFLSVIIVIAVLVMALGVAAVVLFSRGSLGEKMSLILNQDATNTPTAAAPVVIVVTATPAPEKLSPTVEVVEPTATPTAEPAATVQEGACGTRGTLTLLFVGADFSGGVWPQGADTVRVIKVDYDQQKITVVAFPRDLWLSTAGLANQNINQTRLGLAYHYAKAATIGTDKHRITTATTMVGQTLYDTFGIAPQTYFTLQLDTLPGLVDALDGVDINNPTAFISDYHMYFPAGQQHLNGKQSREFVRTYRPGGDDARRQRQNLFLESLQATLLNAGLVTQLPDLYNSFNAAVTTDLSPMQITQLACMLEVVPVDKVEVYEVAGDLVTPINVGERIPALLPKVDQVKAKLVEWIGE